jgi:hypothetical protein
VITAAELAEMRDDLEDSLPDLAVIQTRGFLSDGGGGGTTTWTVAGTVSCRVTPVSSSGEGEAVRGGRVHPDTEYVFTFPYDTAITDTHQVVHAGGTFTATAVRAPKSWEISRRVEMKEVA